MIGMHTCFSCGLDIDCCVCEVVKRSEYCACGNCFGAAVLACECTCRPGRTCSTCVRRQPVITVPWWRRALKAVLRRLRWGS